MDEIGRGTTPEDGIALAYACLHHLYHINQCRALFATHFHILADMALSTSSSLSSSDSTSPPTSSYKELNKEKMDQLTCLCTDVAQNSDGTSFSYVHRLRRGVNRHSYALKVAKLAGPSISFCNPVLWICFA